ncbi:MAG: hydroxyacid dehydrogenase [Lachnospirales bacterium]
MNFKVLIPQGVSSVGTDYLKNKGYEIVNGSSDDIETIKREVVDCDAILLRTALINNEIIEAGKKLKVIGRHGIGVDNIDIDTATKNGVQVTNGPLSNANTVAEYTLSCILALAKKTVEVNNNFKEKGYVEYRPNVPKAVELTGKKVGIIGMGKIGKLVGKKCHFGFDMDVIGFDPYVRKEDVDYPINIVSDLDTIFKDADFVCLHTPLTDETRKMVNKNKLSMMKESSFLVNAGRGEIVVEKDLLWAIENKTISGAALDVFEEEPTPNDNPLFNYDNVIVSPHTASHSLESLDRMSLHAAIGIDEVLSGEKVSWPINKI